jgi:hypothetical protein
MREGLFENRAHDLLALADMLDSLAQRIKMNVSLVAVQYVLMGER